MNGSHLRGYVETILVWSGRRETDETPCRLCAQGREFRVEITNQKGHFAVSVNGRIRVPCFSAASSKVCRNTNWAGRNYLANQAQWWLSVEAADIYAPFRCSEGQRHLSVIFFSFEHPPSSRFCPISECRRFPPESGTKIFRWAFDFIVIFERRNLTF